MKKRTGDILAAAAASLVGAWALPAMAQTWTAGSLTDVTWQNSANWSPGTVPVSGSTATFTTSSVNAIDVLNPGNNPTLGTATVITSVLIGASNSVAVNTIQFSASNTDAFVIGGNTTNVGTIDLDAGGTITTAVTSSGTPTSALINSSILLGGAATFSETGSTGASANLNQAALQIAGNISGSGNLTVSGAHGWGVVFEGNNSGYTGNLDVTTYIGLGVSATVFGSSNTITMETGTSLFWNVSVTNTNYIINGTVTGTFGGNYTEGGTLTVNPGDTLNLSTGGGNGPAFSAQLEGSGNINNTQGNVTLNGAVGNTLTGTYTFSSNLTSANTLNLSKTGGALAIDGPLVVTNKGTVIWHGNGEVVSSDVPSFSGVNTLMELNGFTQTLAGVTDTGTGGTVENNSATIASTLTLSTVGSNTFHGVIANGGAAVLNLAVSGSGTQTLTNTSTYTGSTTITGGTLALTGSGALGNTAISITAGTFAPRAGTSAGSGSASLSLSGTGVFDMTGDNGNTLGTFTLSGSGTALTLGGGGTMMFDLGATLGSNDVLAVTGGGSASTSGTTSLSIDTAGDASLALGDYTLITAAGGLGSGFSLSSPGVTIGANSYTFSLADSTSTAEILTVSTAAVPEPASLGLLGVAAVGLLGRRRRHA